MSYDETKARIRALLDERNREHDDWYAAQHPEDTRFRRQREIDLDFQAGVLASTHEWAAEILAHAIDAGIITAEQRRQIIARAPEWGFSGQARSAREDE